jgi:hypothetical protein
VTYENSAPAPILPLTCRRDRDHARGMRRPRGEYHAPAPPALPGGSRAGASGQCVRPEGVPSDRRLRRPRLEPVHLTAQYVHGARHGLQRRRRHHANRNATHPRPRGADPRRRQSIEPQLDRPAAGTRLACRLYHRELGVVSAGIHAAAGLSECDPHLLRRHSPGPRFFKPDRRADDQQMGQQRDAREDPCHRARSDPPRSGGVSQSMRSTSKAAGQRNSTRIAPRRRRFISEMGARRLSP